ncbi:hypothetical protein BB560_003764, partial [Smittium megazygosporum]
RLSENFTSLSREIPCRGLGAYIVHIFNITLTKVSRSESQTAISGLGRRVGQIDAGQTGNAEYYGTEPDQSPHSAATRLVLPSSSSKGSLYERNSL